MYNRKKLFEIKDEEDFQNFLRGQLLKSIFEVGEDNLKWYQKLVDFKPFKCSKLY